MIRTLIIDDEKPARERLKRLVSQSTIAEVCGEAADGADALEQIRTLQPDLLLLDIRMPEVDGMKVAKEISKQSSPPLIIFTTAYSEHALEAFGVEAVDYLLKPIRFETLLQSLKRVEKRVTELASNDDYDQPYLRAIHQGTSELIPVDEILLLLADNKYVTAYTSDRQIILDESLKQIEDKFANFFVRVHRNALVKTGQIIGCEKDREGRLFALLRDLKQRVEVSRRHHVEIRKLVKERAR